MDVNKYRREIDLVCQFFFVPLTLSLGELSESCTTATAVWTIFYFIPIHVQIYMGYSWLTWFNLCQFLKRLFCSVYFLKKQIFYVLGALLFTFQINNTYLDIQRRVSQSPLLLLSTAPRHKHRQSCPIYASPSLLARDRWFDQIKKNLRPSNSSSHLSLYYCSYVSEPQCSVVILVLFRLVAWRFPRRNRKSLVIIEEYVVLREAFECNAVSCRKHISVSSGLEI